MRDDVDSVKGGVHKNPIDSGVLLYSSLFIYCNVIVTTPTYMLWKRINEATEIPQLHDGRTNNMHNAL